MKKSSEILEIECKYNLVPSPTSKTKNFVNWAQDAV